jgi:4-hydroxybenzoate polyprenyltransferase
MRLPYWLIESLLCVLFIITFQNGFYNPGLIALAVLGVTFVGAGGAAVNDYFDRESDAITHPERPIPSKQVSPTNAATFSALMFAMGLAVSFAINSLAFGIAALNVVLFTVYPRFLKRLSGLLSNLVMGYIGATIALFAGAVVFQTINVASLSFVGMIAGGAIGLNVLKDVLTIDGDVKAGYPTLAARRGVRIAAAVGALSLLLSAMASPLPFFARVVGVAYLVPVAVWASLVIYVAVSLLRTPDVQNVRQRLRMFTMSTIIYPIALIANAIHV